MAKKYKLEEIEHDLREDDILCSSWGYGQTNVDFYQVVRITPKKVVLRELQALIKETGFMCGEATTLPNLFMDLNKAKPNLITCKVSHSEYLGDCVYFRYRGAALKWDGKPKYVSWYA